MQIPRKLHCGSPKLYYELNRTYVHKVPAGESLRTLQPWISLKETMSTMSMKNEMNTSLLSPVKHFAKPLHPTRLLSAGCMFDFTRLLFSCYNHNRNYKGLSLEHNRITQNLSGHSLQLCFLKKTCRGSLILKQNYWSQQSAFRQLIGSFSQWLDCLHQMVWF